MKLSKSKDQSKELENYIDRLNVLFTKYKTIEDGSVKSMLIISCKDEYFDHFYHGQLFAPQVQVQFNLS